MLIFWGCMHPSTCKVNICCYSDYLLITTPTAMPFAMGLLPEITLFSCIGIYDSQASALDQCKGSIALQASGHPNNLYSAPPITGNGHCDPSGERA